MKEGSSIYPLPLPTIRRYPIYLRAIKAKIAGGDLTLHVDMSKCSPRSSDSIPF